MEMASNCRKVVFCPESDVRLSTSTEVLITDDEGALPDKSTHQSFRTKTIDVALHVSSNKLIAASPYFSTLLSGILDARKVSNLKGSIEIVLADEDAAALTVLMTIIHGRKRKVPQRVDLHFLLKLVVAIDKYQLHETVQPFTEIWMDNATRLISNDDDDYYHADVVDALHLLSLAWNFRHANLFDKAASFLVYRVASPLDHMLMRLEDGFSVPRFIISKSFVIFWRCSEVSYVQKVFNVILEKLEARRITILSDMLSEAAFHFLNFPVWASECYHQVSGDGTACENEIAASFFGACADIGIFPIPELPFICLSVDGLLLELQNLKVDTRCECGKPKAMSRMRYRPCDGLVEELYDDCLLQIIDMDGLKLEDLISEDERSGGNISNTHPLHVNDGAEHSIVLRLPFA